MFPAYSSAGESSVSKQNESESQKKLESDWLKSQSFARARAQIKTEPHEPPEVKHDAKKHKKSRHDPDDANDSDDKHRGRKHKKKEKKSKKKKKKHSRSASLADSSDSGEEPAKEENVMDLLCDKIYLEFFAKFTTDEIKRSYFFDDFPGLTYRNAFRIDKKGDRNNLCFDSLHFKQLANYRTPFEPGATTASSRITKQALKAKKKLSRKQLRRYIINELKQKRYFIQVDKLKSITCPQQQQQPEQRTQPAVKPTVSSTLSDKMWLYLEMRKEFNADCDLKAVDKTGDYMKHLTDHKTDVNKWLEFIDYQSNSKKEGEQQLNQLVVFERKLSIFEKAIKENPTSFRLRIELIKLKANSIELTESLNSVEKVEADFLALLFSESSLSYQIISKMKHLDQFKILTNLFEIWFELIKFFVNNSAASLNFNKIRRVYVKFFQYFLNSSNPIIIKNTKTHLFLNSVLKGLESYCEFLSRAGYFEKGLAAYQSLLDFNFCTHSASYPDLDLKSRKSMFELYAEIGLPKFGENLSSGWLNCLEVRDNLFQKLESEIDLNRYDDYLDSNEEKLLAMKSIRIEYRWLEIERLRSTLNWYPFYAKTAIGESIDDCIDPDRLINFEEDTGFILFDLNEETECFRFSLLCKFFKYLRIVTWNEECLDLKINTDESCKLSLNDLNSRIAILTSNLAEDNEYVKYLNEKFAFFKQTRLSSHASFSFIQSIFECLFDLENDCFKLLDETEKANRIKTMKSLAKNAIDFVRNCLAQSISSFSSVKFRTSLIVLKWKFEISLLELLSKRKPSSTEIIQNDLSEYFDPKTIKQNLLNQTKLDLSLEANRSNFELWKQYGLLKWLLIHSKFNYDTKKPTQINLKETRKVFDNLLVKSATTGSSINQSDRVDVFSLCADYVELELGIYYRQFDIETTSLNAIEFDIGFASIHSQNGFFDLNDPSEMKLQPLRKEEIVTISEMLVKNCLNIEAESKSKTKATFQIGITGTTRLLLIKRDFQNEYTKQSNDCLAAPTASTNLNETYLTHKKLFHFHRVYSLFLLCVDDLEKLIELNDSLLRQPIASMFHSKLIEFYLSLLNYLHFQQNRVTKFMYRGKIFAIIRSVLPFNSNTDQQTSCQISLIRLLQTSLIRFKLKNSNLFCSQLIENNDIDLVVQQMAVSLSHSCSGLVWLSLIFTNINRLDRIHKAAEEQQQAVSTNLGIHNQIRRQFEQALKFNSKSAQLWLFYLQFELKYSQTEANTNRLLYVYYQSIRNVPYCKTLFLNAIQSLPEKYNEIMSLLYVKEVRLYLPIQELNILLEPIKDRGELAAGDDLAHDYDTSQLGLIDLNVSSDESSGGGGSENESNESPYSTPSSPAEDFEFDSSGSEEVEKLEFD